MPTRLLYAAQLVAPVATALAAVVLARYFIAPGVDLDGMARGLAGPGTWPKIMLYAAAACSIALFLRNLFRLRKAAAADEFDHVVQCCDGAVKPFVHVRLHRPAPSSCSCVMCARSSPWS